MVLPDLTGLHLEDAKAVLRNAGFTSWRVQYSEEYADEFAVVEHRPRAGSLVERGRLIELTIARQSLLQFLPQIYQQVAATGTSFLRGYLYVVQQLSDGVNERLDHLDRLFDPRSADPEFLPWLASWIAITLSPDWDEQQRRRMLLAATRLFPFRGTARAIREFVRIYSGAAVVIEENTWPFNGFRIGVHSTIGLDTVILPPMNLAHCFVVRLDRPASEVLEDEIIKIHQIIQAQRPAHTTYFLAFPDEVDTGEMGVFMEIGVAPIGSEAVGVGAGAPIVVGGSPPAAVAEAAERAPVSPAAGGPPRVRVPRGRRAAEEPEAAAADVPAEEAKDESPGRPPAAAKKKASARKKTRSARKKASGRTTSSKDTTEG